ncbi:MAG: hypothetical protein ACTS73_08690 [Arsenophonus sp. NEOnobi-MAG3]
MLPHGFTAVLSNNLREQDRLQEQYQYQGLMELLKIKEQLNIKICIISSVYPTVNFI